MTLFLARCFQMSEAEGEMVSCAEMDPSSDWVFPWDSDALGELSTLTLGACKDFYVARVC